MNISIIIASCLINQGKFNCLIEVINNIKKFIKNNEIIIGFDKVGPNKKQIDILNKYNVIYFIHNKGLGYTFNNGSNIASNNIVLQIEDDWIINNKYIKTFNDFDILLNKCIQILYKYKECCIRLDGGMFDEIGGNNSYPLGWKKHYYNNFNYYEYNLPTKKEMDNNFWLHYAFSNHPHLKFKNITIKNPYPENVNPGDLENNYSIEWILKKFKIFYVPINEDSIKIHGWTNPDKNIFKHIGDKFSYRK